MQYLRGYVEMNFLEKTTFFLFVYFIYRKTPFLVPRDKVRDSKKSFCHIKPLSVLFHLVKVFFFFFCLAASLLNYKNQLMYQLYNHNLNINSAKQSEVLIVTFIRPAWASLLAVIDNLVPRPALSPGAGAAV
jgi:hypothetical protein